MNNKAIGIIGILFGLFAFGSFFFIGDNSKLIVPISDNFFVRYFTIITIINSGLFFLLAGILGFFGILIPKTKYEKARNQLFVIFFMAPFFISLLTTIFTCAGTRFWKASGWAVLFYILWSLYTNLKTLKKGRVG